MLRISSLYIPCILRWSGTNLRVYGLLCTASLQISYVLNQSGTNAKERSSMRTASLRISWVLGIAIIRRRIISEGFILFCFFSWVRVKFYGQNADQPLNWYFFEHWCKIWWFNYWTYTLNYAIYRCINNECTPKTMIFWKKRWKHTISWLFYHYKTYEDILKFNF